MIFENLVNIIKSCEEQIGGGVKVGIGMDTEMVVLAAKRGKQELIRKIAVAEFLSVVDQEIIFLFFVKQVKEQFGI